MCALHISDLISHKCVIVLIRVVQRYPFFFCFFPR